MRELNVWANKNIASPGCGGDHELALYGELQLSTPTGLLARSRTGTRISCHRTPPGRTSINADPLTGYDTYCFSGGIISAKLFLLYTPPGVEQMDRRCRKDVLRRYNS